MIAHGLFGSMRNWMSYAKKLQAVARIHLVDMRNHGGSPWADQMDYPSMAADLLAYLDSQQLEKTSILGHSMGGKVAMQLALSHGDRIDRLLIADIAPVAYEHDFDNYLGAMRTSPLFAASREDIDIHLANHIAKAHIRAFLLQNLVRSDQGFAWRINIDAIDRNMSSIMAAPQSEGASPFAGQSMFLRGTNSDYVLPDHRSIIKRLFPNSRTVSLKNAGHWLHAEQPDAFLKAVTLFFGLT